MSKLYARIKAKAARRVQTFALAQREPPAEIQLWNIGENPTDYGVHLWSQRSIDSVFAKYDARGNPLLIDIEHMGTVLPNGELAPTGGYARLENRNGAPWLIFDWSAYAAEQIGSGAKRFLSPEYDVDPDTNEITALYVVSLVASPGTHSARVLATSKEEKPMNLTMFLAALRACMNNEDPEAVKAAVQNLIDETASMTGDDADPAPVVDAPPDAGAVDAAAPAPAGADKKEGPPAADDDDKKEMASAGDGKIAASSARAPAGATGSAADAAEARILAAAATATTSVDNARRDLLIDQHAHRFPTDGLRKLCSALPFAQAKAIVDALPESAATGRRIAATRGATQSGDNDPALGLQGDQLAEMRAKMGRIDHTSMAPKREGGALQLSAMTPTKVREMRLAKAVQK